MGTGERREKKNSGARSVRMQSAGLGETNRETRRGMRVARWWLRPYAHARERMLCVPMRMRESACMRQREPGREGKRESARAVRRGPADYQHWFD